MLLKWDGSINIGTLVQIGVVLWGIHKLLGRLDRLETKVDPLWDWFLKQVIFPKKGV